ncbi:MAG: hypothetical protein RLZZ156_2325 [Deinococcota bacterium]|jgi:signal transduction histidine kinase
MVSLPENQTKLRLARVVWWVWAGVAVALFFVFSLYLWHFAMTTPCSRADCSEFLGWLSRLGLGIEVFALLYLISFAVPVLIWLALAFWVFLAQPRNIWSCVFSSVFLIGWYGEISAQYLRGSLPFAIDNMFDFLGLPSLNSEVFSVYLRGILKMLADNLLVLMVFAFPDGKLYPSWSKFYLVVLALLSFGYSMPFLRETAWNYAKLPFPFNFLVNLFLLFVLIWGLLLRYRHSSDTVRHQVRGIIPIMIVNTVIYSLDLIFVVLLKHGIFSSQTLIEPLGDLLLNYLNSFGMIWLAVAVAQIIVQQQLFDIRFVLNRALAYSAVVLSTGLIYGLIVGGLGTLLRQADVWLSVLATGVIAVLFQPLLSQFRRFANRLFYGERQDPYQAISHLGRTLEAVVKTDELLGIIVQTVAGTLKLPFVELVTPKQTISQGQAVGQVLEFVMQVKNVQVGVLRVSQRFSGEAFLASELRLLEDLTARAAVAVQEALLSQEIQASGQAIVLAREEERKRIRRDLHDGLGASLAGIAMNLQVSKSFVVKNPTRAEDLIAASAKGVQEAIADIRRLVYDLRPPALDDLGLAGALRQQIGQMIGVLPEIHMDITEMPAALEVAVYRIASEALNNIQKHAHASAVRFNLYQDENGVLLEIYDNGVGIARNRSSGVGLQSMRERTQELGGRLEIENHNGTRIMAWLPLHKGAT